MGPMMTCGDVEHFMDDYLEGRLGFAKRVLFRLHLAMCDDCVAYIAKYQATIALGKAAFQDPEADASDHVPEELITAILDVRMPD
jgi:anti-sigma factor RsiW